MCDNMRSAVSSFVQRGSVITSVSVMSVTWLVSTANPVSPPSAMVLAQMMSAFFLLNFLREFSIRFSVSIENPTSI